MIQYFKIFDNHAGYTAYTASTEEFITPNVSICKAELEVHYTPVPDYSKNYFTTVAKTSGTISFSGSTTANTLSYSKDNGATWSSPMQKPSATTLTAGDKVLWKGECEPDSYFGIGMFTAASTSAQFDVEGNVMSLLFGDNFKGQTSLVGKNDAFSRLFHNNTKVISAENLSLPATTLASGCYQYMFYNCTNVTTAPELPATTLGESCYQNMFDSCTSLTSGPSVLPSTELAQYCYQGMFSGCTSLTTAPQLPATTLANQCYYQMFSNCTSLTTATALPATTLTQGCYQGMFSGCTSLTTAPELHATTLASSCYYEMFRGCTSLATASELPATTLAFYCYKEMFSGCTNLTTAPELPATTLVRECYEAMFQGCTSLNNITCLATDISETNCTSNWVYGVPSGGTFTKPASMTSWTSGVNGIPDGWTVQDASA